MAVPFFPSLEAVVDLLTAKMTPSWLRWAEGIQKLIAVFEVQLGSFQGAAVGLLAAQPTALTAADAGRLYYVTDFGHCCRWDGAQWTFAPGDPGNGFVSDHAFAPQEVGWQLSNGAATTYLTVGGTTLTETAFLTLILGPTMYFRR